MSRAAFSPNVDLPSSSALKISLSQIREDYPLKNLGDILWKTKMES